MTDTRAPVSTAPPALAVHNIQIVYGGAIEAVRDVSLEVRPGQIVALLGSNGAGKSSVLKAISGVLDAEDGEIEKGSSICSAKPSSALPRRTSSRTGWCRCPKAVASSPR
ncbi:ATP-binding cassette domain-containing protein [Comamonas badia]|uniref:ATP-binding cassette domain-containing protein n=1 Tax=Comamonas badia TaxID=265291 RepID=UPI00316ACAC8